MSFLTQRFRPPNAGVPGVDVNCALQDLLLELSKGFNGQGTSLTGFQMFSSFQATNSPVGQVGGRGLAGFVLVKIWDSSGVSSFAVGAGFCVVG